MFRLFRISARVEDLERAFKDLQQEFKFYKEELEKIEIKALESRKIYAKKLKRLEEVEENEKEDNSKGIYNSVLLKE